MKQARGQRGGCIPGSVYVYVCVRGGGRAEVAVGIAISDQWQVVSGPERLAFGGTTQALFYTFYVHMAKTPNIQNACMNDIQQLTIQGYPNQKPCTERTHDPSCPPVLSPILDPFLVMRTVSQFGPCDDDDDEQ